MISPPDPFALNFDSIPIEPRRCLDPVGGEFSPESPPGPAPAALTSQGPGFYLVDDCNGRFSIDRETGIVSLRHEHLLSIEAGAIHPVHIHVVEKSGARYDLEFRLRMTGRVPQIVGAEENDALAGLTALPLRDLLAPEQKMPQRVAAPEPAPLPWVQFSAAGMLLGKRPLYGETAPFGSLFESPAAFPGVFAESGKLRLEMAPPPPASAEAAWAI